MKIKAMLITLALTLAVIVSCVCVSADGAKITVSIANGTLVLTEAAVDVTDIDGDGYIATLFGRRRALPEISARNKNIVNFGKRVAMNTPIQGTAADIIKIAMIRVYRRLMQENLSAQLILQVHDELIVEAPEHEVAQVEQLLKEEMEKAVSLKVQLKADVGVGKTWIDAK